MASRSRWASVAKLPKAITIELMDVKNRKVLQRAKFAVPKGQRMTRAGVDKVLETYCDDLQKRQPDNRYRLVPLQGHRYRLVWEPQSLSDMATEHALNA